MSDSHQWPCDRHEKAARLFMARRQQRGSVMIMILIIVIIAVTVARRQTTADAPCAASELDDVHAAPRNARTPLASRRFALSASPPNREKQLFLRNSDRCHGSAITVGCVTTRRALYEVGQKGIFVIPAGHFTRVAMPRLTVYLIGFNT